MGELDQYDEDARNMGFVAPTVDFVTTDMEGERTDRERDRPSDD